MGASSGSEWVLPMEEKGLQGPGLRSCLSVLSLITPANRVFPRETVPSRHRQVVVQKDGCLQWNEWERLMERMGASNGTNGSGLWKELVHLMEKMGAYNGNLWVTLVESRCYFTCKTQN